MVDGVKTLRFVSPDGPHHTLWEISHVEPESRLAPLVAQEPPPGQAPDVCLKPIITG